MSAFPGSSIITENGTYDLPNLFPGHSYRLSIASEDLGGAVVAISFNQGPANAFTPIDRPRFSGSRLADTLIAPSGTIRFTVTDIEDPIRINLIPQPVSRGVSDSDSPASQGPFSMPDFASRADVVFSARALRQGSGDEVLSWESNGRFVALPVSSGVGPVLKNDSRLPYPTPHFSAAAMQYAAVLPYPRTVVCAFKAPQESASILCPFAMNEGAVRFVSVTGNPVLKGWYLTADGTNYIRTLDADEENGNLRHADHWVIAVAVINGANSRIRFNGDDNTLVEGNVGTATTMATEQLAFYDSNLALAEKWEFPWDLSDAEEYEFVRWLNDAAEIHTSQIIFIGSSITQGIESGKAYPDQVVKNLKGNWTPINYGVGGQSLSEAEDAGIITAALAKPNPLAHYRIAHIEGLTNNIWKGETVDEAYDCLIRVKNLALANGWDPIVHPIMPRGGAFSAVTAEEFEERFMELNLRLKANAAAEDYTYLEAIADDPLLQDPLDEDIFADEIHQTELGNRIYGRHAEAATAALSYGLAP